MPSNEQILNKLLSTLHQRFAIDTAQVNNASRLSDIGIDSLHLVDIMLDMENEFGFRFESLLLPPDPSLEQISLAILRDSDTPG
nr:phosphopantetheine-binding protein [uncultured Noviherbaspirillum sp.]